MKAIILVVFASAVAAAYGHASDIKYQREASSEIRTMRDKEEDKDSVAKRGGDLDRQKSEAMDEVAAKRGVIRDFIRGIFGFEEPKVVVHGFVPWLTSKLRALVLWIRSLGYKGIII